MFRYPWPRRHSGSGSGPDRSCPAPVSGSGAALSRVARRLEAQGHGTGHVRRREAGAVPADEQAGVAAGADRSRPGGEHAYARGCEVGLAAAVPARARAAERRDRPVRVVAVIGTDDQRKVAGGDGADGGGRVAVTGREPGLAAPARVVPLDPGVESAAADPPAFQGDRPVPRAADRVEVRDDVVVAVVGVAFAVIDPADYPAGDEEVGSLPEAYRTASGVTRRIDADGELVRAVVPDLDLVEGDVGRVDDDGERKRFPGRDRAAGVRAPAEIVAGAVDDEPPGRGGQQFIERTFNQCGAVPRPA